MGEVADGLATIDDMLARGQARDERWYFAELLRIKGELLLKSSRQSAPLAKQCFEEAIKVALRDAWERLTPGRRRGWVLHFNGAKQSKTRSARIERATPRILEGFGMHD